MASFATIFWRDFRSDFLSLKTGAVAFFFLLFMGVFFFSYLDTYFGLQTQGSASGNELPTLSQLMAALFAVLHYVLILMLPALTMSSFAEEKRLQTIRLLQVAPITSFAIVGGKFAAMATTMLCILAASLVFPAFLLTHGNPDLGILCTSYLGLFLLICSQLAFGLWVSSLTRQQFLAFLFTMCGLFGQALISLLAGSLRGFTITHSLVRYLGAGEHLTSFFKGMLTVSDISYFVLLTAFFLYLTQVSYDSLRWR